MKRRNFRITIVTFSILLMTCSALISYSLVRSNDDQIANLQFEIKKKQEKVQKLFLDKGIVPAFARIKLKYED